MAWALTLVSALLGGVVGAWLTYFFGLRKDKEERRRERIVAHLVEAYRNIEDAVARENLSDEQLARLESSMAATFLFGSVEAANEAINLPIDNEADRLDMLPLLRQLRKDLRQELGLKSHDVELKFLRLPRNKGAKK